MSTALATETTTKIKPITMWRVVFNNDDYTPMDFVIAVLVQLYGKSIAEAEEITMAIHKNGRGIAGVYTKEIAEQKAADTVRVARSHQHPLFAFAESA